MRLNGAVTTVDIIDADIVRFFSLSRSTAVTLHVGLSTCPLTQTANGLGTP